LQQTIIQDPPVGKQIASGTKSSVKSRSGQSPNVFDPEVELGIWLSAIESFVGTAAHPFVDKMNMRGHDWSGDLALTNSGLITCLEIISQMASTALQGCHLSALSIDDIDSLTDVVSDALHVGESLSRAKPVSFNEWRAWCRLVTNSFNTGPAFEKVVRTAAKAGEASVPPRLVGLINREELPFGDRFDLGVVVPGFAKILQWLRIVENMLTADAPLKSSLLIFARVYEDTHDLVGHINRRLQRFSDEDAELFRALDSASYIASIELRKVFDQELAGLVAVRSAITVYARTETAFASLRDNIQQILAGLARLIDATVKPSDLFPMIGEKLESSLTLRSELATMTKLVRAAETDIDSNRISDATLHAFLSGPVPSLFYKDRESVERFIEEILRTSDRKDLVPILHRFGAYLETLFSHVNNRTVLRDHPFDEE
jgi:hypothetical protein